MPAGVAYHRRFRHFHPATVRATERLVHARLWGAPAPEQRRAVDKWLRTVSAVYGIEPPSVVWGVPMDGVYFPDMNTIGLPYFTITTLLHEFRHALQRAGKVEGFDRTFAGREHAEDDARAWSLSLFHRVAPRRFRNMVSAGRVHFVNPEDL